MIPSNLCILIEQLEDARQFHELAAEVSDGALRETHRERSQGDEAMLSEIRCWSFVPAHPVTLWMLVRLTVPVIQAPAIATQC